MTKNTDQPQELTADVLETVSGGKRPDGPRRDIPVTSAFTIFPGIGGTITNPHNGASGSGRAFQVDGVVGPGVFGLEATIAQMSIDHAAGGFTIKTLEASGGVALDFPHVGVTAAEIEGRAGQYTLGAAVGLKGGLEILPDGGWKASVPLPWLPIVAVTFGQNPGAVNAARDAAQQAADLDVAKRMLPGDPFHQYFDQSGTMASGESGINSFDPNDGYLYGTGGDGGGGGINSFDPNDRYGDGGGGGGGGGGHDSLDYDSF